MKSSENVKKAKRLNEEDVKQQLIDFLVKNDTIEREELNKRAEKVDEPDDAANIINEYEETLCTKVKVLYPFLTMRRKCSVGFVKRKSL